MSLKNECPQGRCGDVGVQARDPTFSDLESDLCRRALHCRGRAQDFSLEAQDQRAEGRERGWVLVEGQ